MKEYLTVSEIAGLFGLNRQTIHFYDKKGLFIPEYRDKQTGYRKYSLEQVANLALICYLRKIGFSIERIKNVMNLKDINLTVNQLKDQSEDLRIQQENIFKTDSVIQRKIGFVERKLKDIEIGKVEIRNYNRRSYLLIGKEELIYSNEMFYFFPTIAFYNYNKDKKSYNRVFAAYIETEVGLDKKYIDNIKVIERQDLLCYFHEGPYEEILERVSFLRKQYSHLKLDQDFVCFNIVDQFLEKDNNKFITEVQIPILE